jgi:hypothetical protein
MIQHVYFFNEPFLLTLKDLYYKIEDLHKNKLELLFEKNNLRTANKF